MGQIASQIRMDEKRQAPRSMYYEALRGVKPDSLLSVGVPPRHWVEEESFCSAEVVPCLDGVRFLGEPLSADAGDSLGEPLSVDEGCSHHEARSPSEMHSAGEVRREMAASYAARFHCGEARPPSQTHSADEAPPDVVPESYAARFQAEEVCSLVYSHAGNSRWPVVVDLCGSQESCTVLRRGWPLRCRAH